MSGLEVAAAVAGIVGGFATAVSLLKQWKDRNDNKPKDCLRVIRVTGQLSREAKKIEKAYRKAYKNCGSDIAIGDGTSHEALRECQDMVENDLISNIRNAIEEGRWPSSAEVKTISSRISIRATTVIHELSIRVTVLTEGSRAGQAGGSASRRGTTRSRPFSFITDKFLHIRSVAAIRGRETSSAGGSALPTPTLSEESLPMSQSDHVSPPNHSSSPGSSLPTPRPIARRSGNQQYCPAAVHVQTVGVAKAGVPVTNKLGFSVASVGCPDCYWRHASFPDASPIGSYLGYSWSGKYNWMTLEAPFFTMSHLYIPEDMRGIDPAARGHNVYGCVYCGRQGKVQDFYDINSYGKHVADWHSEELSHEKFLKREPL